MPASISTVAFSSEKSGPLHASKSAKAALLLTDASARRLLPLALSISRAWGADLAAYSLHTQDSHLPERLRRLKTGHAGSPADRAIHELVGSAFRGSQITLRPATDQAAAYAETAPLRMLAWGQPDSPPSGPAFENFCAPSPRPLILLRATDSVVFDEVLVLGWQQSPPASLDALNRIARGLEGPYPLWRLKADRFEQWKRAKPELGPRSLLLVTPCARLGLPLDRLADIDNLSPGPVALLCPSGDPIRYLRSLGAAPN